MDKNKILEEYFDLIKFFQDTVYDDYISNKNQKLKKIKNKINNCVQKFNLDFRYKRFENLNNYLFSQAQEYNSYEVYYEFLDFYLIDLLCYLDFNLSNFIFEFSKYITEENKDSTVFNIMCEKSCDDNEIYDYLTNTSKNHYKFYEKVYHYISVITINSPETYEKHKNKFNSICNVLNMFKNEVNISSFNCFSTFKLKNKICSELLDLLNIISLENNYKGEE